jgi:hypothetical protein
MGWIYAAQDRNQKWNLANAVMKLRVPQNVNFFFFFVSEILVDSQEILSFLFWFKLQMVCKAEIRIRRNFVPMTFLFAFCLCEFQCQALLVICMENE